MFLEEQMLVMRQQLMESKTGDGAGGRDDTSPEG